MAIGFKHNSPCEPMEARRAHNLPDCMLAGLVRSSPDHLVRSSNDDDGSVAAMMHELPQHE